MTLPALGADSPPAQIQQGGLSGAGTTPDGNEFAGATSREASRRATVSNVAILIYFVQTLQRKCFRQSIFRPGGAQLAPNLCYVCVLLLIDFEGKSDVAYAFSVIMVLRGEHSEDSNAAISQRHVVSVRRGQCSFCP